MSAEQQACLLCVMAEGFALDEVRLFLDTHPGDAAALQYLAQRQAACRAAQENYVARFAPLQIDDPSAAGDDAWVNAPGPWEWEG